MYFVDRQKIEDTLTFMEKQLAIIQEMNQFHNDIEKLAIERITVTIIDAVLDVGNAMIDGFIMRDPGSYNDIIDILQDEKVITEEMANDFKKIIPLRKELVQHYLSVDHEKIFKRMHEVIQSLQLFPKHVRDYLKNELGPVSAFKK